MGSPDPGLVWFNAVPVDQARQWLAACCAAPAWVAAVVAGRPYHDRERLLADADAMLKRLTWKEIREALDAHPRIGAQVSDRGVEGAWSRREQAGVADASDLARIELTELNEAYEKRFGFLFLIFASGRTESDIIAAARHRLGNDPVTEEEVVRVELGRIVALRLHRLLAEPRTETPAEAEPGAQARAQAEAGS